MKTVVVTLITRVQTALLKTRRRFQFPFLLGLFAIALVTVMSLPGWAQFSATRLAVASTQTTATCADPLTCYQQGRFEEARALWENAAKAAAQVGDRLNEVSNRLNAAEALKELGAYVRAEQVLTSTLTLVDTTALNQQSEQIALRTLKVKLLRSLSDLYQAQGDLERARTRGQQSLQLAQQLDAPEAISAAYFSLGMIERAGVLREASQLFTTTLLSGKEQQVQLTELLRLLQGPATPVSPALPAPQTTAEQPRRTNLLAVSEAFQQAKQFAPDATTKIRAELSQVSLLVDLLPRLNHYLLGLLSDQAKLMTDRNSDYFIKTLLAEPSIVKDLTPLQPIFRIVRQIDQAPEPPDVAIVDVVQLYQQTRELTQFVVQSFDQLSNPIPQLPNTVDAAKIRLHYAQTLLRLKPIADTADRVDTQLREQLKSVLTTVQSFYTTPQYQAKLPKRATIDPVFKKVRTDLQQPRRSLFLDPLTRARLQQQVVASLQQATQTLMPVITTAQQVNNTRLEATGDVLLASVYGISADLTGATRQWAEVEVLAQRAMQLMQAKDAPDLTLRAQQQYARALVKQSKTTAAQAACRVATTTLQANRRNLVAINQDVQYSFLESVDPFYRECVTALLPTGTAPASQENLQDARDLIEALQLAELDNFFREACIDGQRAAIDTLIEDQKNAKTAVIYPILLSKRKVGVIVKLPQVKALQYYATETPNQDIESVLLRFNQQLTDPVTSTSETTRSLGETIYDWLIKAIRPELQGVDTLVFVADAPFRNIPMAALYDGQRYLIDDFAIALSPGLQLTQPGPNQDIPLKAIGAGLIDIPTKYELEAFPKETIEQEFSTLKRVGILPNPPLLETAFTSTELANQLERNPFNVVHLSTHAAFSSQKEKTYVLMANGRINVDDFSAVLRKRIQQPNGAIELLILSACQTASGDSRAALGLAGVAIRSGARSTMATLWAVDPTSVVQVTDLFYTTYVNSATQTPQATKAKALQAAQLQLKQAGNAPSVWASYVLVGNWL